MEPFLGENMNKLWKIDNKENFYNSILRSSKEDVYKSFSKNEKKDYYGNSYEKKKKRGVRTIYNVSWAYSLFSLQKNICTNFLNNILISDIAYGFVKGKNYFDYMFPHIDFYKKNYYLRLDISDFFGSISYENIRKTMSYYVSDELKASEKREILYVICEILTYQGSVPQGTPSAPVISNIIFRELDIRIQKYCQRFDVIYTRYADDLLFSSSKKIVHGISFTKGIEKIINSRSFRINHDKTIRSKNSISLSGYVIDDDIRLSRKKLKKLNCVIFFLEKKKFSNNEMWYRELNNEINKCEKEKSGNQLDGKYILVNYLAGNRAFLISSLKYSENMRYRNRCIRMVSRIEKQINLITKKEVKKRV